MRELTPEPLTAEAFAAFGSVIEASDDAVKLDINQGHAIRTTGSRGDVADEGGAGVISCSSAPAGELSCAFSPPPPGQPELRPAEDAHLVALSPSGVSIPPSPPFPAGSPGVPSERRLPLPARPRAEAISSS